MERIKSKENETQTFSKYIYEDKSEALEAYNLLTDAEKLAMANVYREAFGGYPWYEVFKCNSCDEFAKTTDPCGHCGNSSFSEAYPIESLVHEYFPHMMSAYTPGVLITLEDNEQMIGFTTGGAITLGKLIEDKYKGNSEILASIINTTGVSTDQIVFYENETCISASLQQKGSGGKLNHARVEAASNLGFEFVCGRTINQPWIKLKEKQLAEFGYDFISFNPTGDNYEVDGAKRQFFMATRVNHE